MGIRRVGRGDTITDPVLRPALPALYGEPVADDSGTVNVPV
jgi:hypothetical protein